MKALVYHGPGERRWESVPDPTIEEPTDVVVRIDASTICGTDLHILKGDVPEVDPGTILGHEAVGTVVAKGDGVTTLAEDDRVLVSCITACGRCRFCKEGHYGLCMGGGGWIFGHLIDGLQADYARVPFADTSVYKIPPGLSDEQVLFLADILPTAYEVGVLNGRVEPGDTVVIVGAGPIGLATIMTAKLHTPGKIVAVDLADARLAKAIDFGADIALNSASEDVVARVMEMTDGLGADVAIEAVGVPETFELCTELIRPGGRVANVGVHGHSATLHLEKLWIRDILITTGLVDTSTTPKLLKLIAGGRLDPTVFATHRFSLAETDGRLRRVRRCGGDKRAEGGPRGQQAPATDPSPQALCGNGDGVGRGHAMTTATDNRQSPLGVHVSVFSRVLVGVDGSAESIEAARQAALLAECPISLVAAYDIAPPIIGATGTACCGPLRRGTAAHERVGDARSGAGRAW